MSDPCVRCCENRPKGHNPRNTFTSGPSACQKDLVRFFLDRLGSQKHVEQKFPSISPRAHWWNREQAPGPKHLATHSNYHALPCLYLEVITPRKSHLASHGRMCWAAQPTRVRSNGQAPTTYPACRRTARHVELLI